jgi:FtsP/CotA-like multicopper oxidase with cupredoxin domain
MSRIRRRWLLFGGGLAAVCVLAVLVFVSVVWFGAKESNVGELSFERELPIPPLLDPGSRDGRTVFELEMQEGESELLSRTRTSTWGYNGPYLGPTLRATRGETVEMRVTNNLPEPETTTHWHGMHLPATADGGPHQVIDRGETWSPSWTIDQPAATLWYHPHPHERTEEHIYRGLAGMFIIDDPQAAELQLPASYGVDDIPVIVQDKRFDGGELSFDQGLFSPIGQLGDEIVVNGITDPHLSVATTLVRLRLLNASTARVYNFGFADGRRFELITTDAGLLEAPVERERIQLSAGERAEIVVELAPGEDVVLRSFEPDLGDTGFFNARFSGGADSFDILELRAANQLRESPELPASLIPPQDGELPDPEADRRFVLGSRDINDRQMDLGRIDQVARAGASETWEVENDSGIPHNFHPHGISFQVLEYDGGPPPPALTGLKDTVFVPPGVTVRLATTAPEYADPDSPYMFHCHLLNHEDRGMMGQLAVAGRGKPVAATPGSARSPPATSMSAAAERGW